MSIRLHIERLVVDAGLLESTDRQDLAAALGRELTLLWTGDGSSHEGEKSYRELDTLKMGARGAFGERLAAALYPSLMVIARRRHSDRSE